MPLAPVVSRRTLFLTWAVLCLVTTLAFAGPVPMHAADVDGDGILDQISLDRRDPGTVRVWLSAKGTISVLRGRVPLVSVVARDLDGDHRAELIAVDAHAGVQVWTKSRNRETFRRWREHEPVQEVFRHPSRHRVDDGPTSDDPTVTASGSPPDSLTVEFERSSATDVHDLRRVVSTAPSSRVPLGASLAPRPPPASRS